jgi:hypothetical protein
MRGDLANTEDSKKLDKTVKKIAKKISQEKQTNLIYEEGHRQDSAKAQFKSKLREFMKLGLSRGFLPDGGLWFKKPWYDENGIPYEDRECMFVFEAKSQGNSGNAIERWADNFDICQKIYPNAKYITFMSGTGCTDNGVLTNFAKDKKTLHNGKVEFYLKLEGFNEDEIDQIMLSYLKKE